MPPDGSFIMLPPIGGPPIGGPPIGIGEAMPSPGPPGIWACCTPPAYSPIGVPVGRGGLAGFSCPNAAPAAASSADAGRRGGRGGRVRPAVEERGRPAGDATAPAPSGTPARAPVVTERTGSRQPARRDRPRARGRWRHDPPTAPAAAGAV